MSGYEAAWFGDISATDGSVAHPFITLRNLLPVGYKLCALLTDARKKAGLTQQELADHLGKPQSFVAKYELGERGIDVLEFLTITKILKVDAAKII